ncbi:hypothetical protein [Pseudomonas sp. NBRC 111123]|uniref:hypothetical protein n=1 Tax=Pseudomonas sp. NBRC 111123 TaxID=1661038 RepID=UPI0012E2C314|nr:hypothetical protein [Pseudomonas sp. NBRC 111123]
MNVLEAVKTIAVELLAFGFWLLAFGFWLLAFGFWLLAFGFWLLAFGSGLSNQVYLQSPGWR